MFQLHMDILCKFFEKGKIALSSKLYKIVILEFIFFLYHYWLKESILMALIPLHHYISWI